MDVIRPRSRLGPVDPVDHPALLVALDPNDPPGEQPTDDPWALHPSVRLGVGEADHPDASWCDLVVADEEEAACLAEQVRAHPVAASALALLLRGADRRGVDEGLVLESATYSALQSGPEFRAWLAQRGPARRRSETGPAVLIERNGASLHLTLNRPQVRNAVNVAMREGLLDGLAVAEADPSITRVLIAGAGPSFSAGGDLDTFGTFPDPASAHLVRLERSVAAALHRLRHRVEVHLHGACRGAGIELPAFAGRIVAASDTDLALPELAYGLIPGAGGTVSVTRRVGRQRCLRLALSTEPIDAHTAREWGLIDEIVGDR